MNLRTAIKFALLGLFLGSSIAVSNASVDTVTHSDTVHVNVDNAPITIESLPGDNDQVIPVTIFANAKKVSKSTKSTHSMKCGDARFQLQGPISQTVRECF